MKVFRLVIEFECEADLDVVIGSIDGIDHFALPVNVCIELVEKFDPKESNDGG